MGLIFPIWLTAIFKPISWMIRFLKKSSISILLCHRTYVFIFFAYLDDITGKSITPTGIAAKSVFPVVHTPTLLSEYAEYRQYIKYGLTHWIWKNTWNMGDYIKYDRLQRKWRSIKKNMTFVLCIRTLDIPHILAYSMKFNAF